MKDYVMMPHFDWHQLTGAPVSIEISGNFVFAVRKDKSSVAIAQKITRHDRRFYEVSHPTTPLSFAERERILTSLQGSRFSIRNKLFIEMSLRTGMRVSALLSQPLSSVYQDGRIVPRFLAIPSISRLIETWIADLARQGKLADDTPLFCSRVRGSDQQLRAMARETAWRMLKAAVKQAGITRHITTESLRKTFGDRLLSEKRPLKEVQRAMGHATIEGTISYLSFRPEFGGTDVEAAG